MFTIRNKTQEFDRNLQPRERRSGFPHLNLRRRTADHPMVLFASVATVSMAAMVFIPVAGPALASFSPNAPVKIERQDGAAGKTARLRNTDRDLACQGQSWGAESAECLAMIAKGSNRDETRKVRVVAGLFEQQSL